MLPNYFSFILLLIIIFKLVITELSDHFQYADLSDTGDLINITDNYNLFNFSFNIEKNICRLSSNNKKHNSFNNYPI